MPRLSNETRRMEHLLISVNPEVQGGAPCIAGTRLPIDVLLARVDAGESWDSLVSDYPDLTEAHVGLGDLCRTFARSAAAVRSYERAVRSRPKKPFYRWKLAVALAAMGLYEKSAAQLGAFYRA